MFQQFHESEDCYDRILDIVGEPVYDVYDDEAIFGDEQVFYVCDESVFNNAPTFDVGDESDEPIFDVGDSEDMNHAIGVQQARDVQSYAQILSHVDENKAYGDKRSCGGCNHLAYHHRQEKSESSLHGRRNDLFLCYKESSYHKIYCRDIPLLPKYDSDAAKLIDHRHKTNTSMKQLTKPKIGDEPIFYDGDKPLVDIRDDEEYDIDFVGVQERGKRNYISGFNYLTHCHQQLDSQPPNHDGCGDRFLHAEEKLYHKIYGDMDFVRNRSYDAPTQGTLSPIGSKGTLKIHPEELIETRLVKDARTKALEALVKWHGLPIDRILSGRVTIS